MKQFILIILSVFLTSSTLLAQDFWEVLPVPNDFRGRSSATNSNGWLFIGTNDGVYLSTEYGNNLEKVGLQNTITALVIDKNNHILAGSGILYYSDDNGVTWQEINTPGFINETYYEDSLIVFGNWGKIFKSSDFGINWVQVLELNSTHLFTSLIKTNNGGLLAGEIGFMGGGGVYRSEDNGDTWEFSGLYDDYISSLAINSNGEIFAGSRGNQIEGGGGVFKSEDNGNTWIELTGAIWVTSMVIDTNDVIYVGAEINSGQGGVFRSVDNGLTWERIISGMGQYPSVEGMCLAPDGYLYTYDSKLYRSIKPIYTSVDDNIKIAKRSLFNIFPNPVNDILAINTTAKNYEILITDATGRIVFHRTTYSENVFNVSKLAQGIYFISVNANGCIHTQMVVKQ